MQEVSVTIQEKALKDGQKAFYLIDSLGFVCGIHETQEQAQRAIGAVTWNVNRGQIKRSKLNKHCQNLKQSSTKK